MVKVRKLVTISQEQLDWIDENSIQLSKYVQKCIDKAMNNG